MKLIWIAVVTLVTTTSAFAQPSGSPSAGKVALARKLYDEGYDAANGGRWNIAFDKFKTSYDLAPRVLTLYNLAIAQAALGRLVEASEGFRKFLRETNDGRYPNERTYSTNQLDQLDHQIARLSLDISNLAGDDSVTIDDAEFPKTVLHEPIPLNPGSHVARVSRDGTVVANRTITLMSGASEQMRIELPVKPPDLQLHRTASADGAPGVSAPLSSSGPVEDRGPHNSFLRSPWFWAAVGVVVVGGAFGTYELTRPDGVVIH